MNGYFDHNATSPLTPAALDAYVEASRRHWHNPSGLYREAAAARRALEDAREEIAEMLGADARRVVFNSGATEGCNAILNHFEPAAIVTSAVEHPCVAEPARDARTLGCSPDGTTVLAPPAPGTALVSVMAANNETGVLQPWREALELCRQHGVRFHCDASQWIGKLPASGLGECDFVTATAHKFGGPKGVGFMLVPAGGREGDAAAAGQRGGPQEHGHRAGTENLPAVAAMLVALRESRDHQPDPRPRDAFEHTVAALLPGSRFVGAAAERLWNTSMLILPQHKNLRWLTRLSARGFSVSTGSACSAGKDNPSRVLEAMGFSYHDMGRALRVSSGPHTSSADWQSLADALAAVHQELRAPHNPSLGKISLNDL